MKSTDFKKFLIIGGTGVAGSAAIRAIRDHFGKAAAVTALWYGRKREDLSIEGADNSIFGDITDPDTLSQVGKEAGKQFHFAFFATALGDVGFPIKEATPRQISDACSVSFDPLLRLEEEFSIGTIVAYSTFYNLKHQMVNYGAMGHAKERIEKWVLEPGRSRHVCIRAGAFESASSKAIKLLLRRRAKELENSGDPVLEGFFRGRKPSEAVALLEKAVYEEERSSFGDTFTKQSDLEKAHLYLFNSPDARFVNVCGKRIWLSEEPQLL